MTGRKVCAIVLHNNTLGWHFLYQMDSLDSLMLRLTGQKFTDLVCRANSLSLFIMFIIFDKIESCTAVRLWCCASLQFIVRGLKSAPSHQTKSFMQVSFQLIRKRKLKNITSRNSINTLYQEKWCKPVATHELTSSPSSPQWINRAVYSTLLVHFGSTKPAHSFSICLSMFNLPKGAKRSWGGVSVFTQKLILKSRHTEVWMPASSICIVTEVDETECICSLTFGASCLK